MRTTVTLDPDVERLLKKASHRQGKSFKKVLNEAVRRSLRGKRGDSPSLLKPMSMKLQPGIDPRGLNRLADDMEADAFLDSTRRLKHKRK